MDNQRIREERQREQELQWNTTVNVDPRAFWNMSALSGVTISSGDAWFTDFNTIRQQPRIHKENGPAVFYEDGSVGYFWKGVRVPQWVIMNPQRITLNIILKEKNIEVRRSMIEIFGEGRFLKELGAEKIHEDDWGILWKVERVKIQRRTIEDLSGITKPFKEAEDVNKILSIRVSHFRNIEVNREINRLFGNVRKLMYVQVKDPSTDRQYFLPVPSTMKKAKQAISWTFRLKEDEYNPIQQT